MSRLAVLCLVLGALTCSSAAYRIDGCSSDSYRLPKNINPFHYDLTVEVDLADDHFKGDVTIHVKVEGEDEQLSLNQIALHSSRQMSIEKAEYLELASGQTIEVTDICRNKNDVVILSLKESLTAGSEGQLRILFTGKYAGGQVGFYKSRERGANGETYDIALTQFEPIDARKAFPCFDEPAFKSTFNLTLVHGADLVAIANTELISSEERDGRKVSRFAETPNMSTYLVAYAVGQFDFMDREALGGRVQLRFYTPKGRSHESEFALDIAARALTLLEDYFDVEFPLNKIDFVSVAQYSAAAMENWGLITALDSVILNSPENYGYEDAFAAQVVVHELAHQWFGNLVTMDWWNDIWLNEGFANWVQYNLTAVLMPHINFDSIFIRSSLRYVFENDFDGKETAVAKREHQEDVSEDTLGYIVYEKGCAIIKNLQDEFLHPDNFRSALRHYMKTHAYGNARSEDLWHSMELYSREPVRQFMESWLYQDGHPILTVDVRDGFLSVKQSVYTQVRSLLTNPDKRWIIPVTVLVSDGESRFETISVTLTGEEKEEELIDLPSWYNPKVASHWLKLNCNATGLYNVEYSKRLLKNLRRPVEKRLMSALDRIDVVMNYGILANGDYILPIPKAEVLKWYRKETEPIVLREVLNEFDTAKSDPDTDRLFFKVFGDYLAKKNFNQKEETNSQYEEIRLSILTSALTKNHKPTIEALLTLIDETKPLDSIPEPIRSHLFIHALKKSSKKQLSQLSSMVHKMAASTSKELMIERLKAKLK